MLLLYLPEMLLTSLKEFFQGLLNIFERYFEYSIFQLQVVNLWLGCVAPIRLIKKIYWVKLFLS